MHPTWPAKAQDYFLPFMHPSNYPNLVSVGPEDQLLELLELCVTWLKSKELSMRNILTNILTCPGNAALDYCYVCKTKHVLYIYLVMCIYIYMYVIYSPAFYLFVLYIYWNICKQLQSLYITPSLLSPYGGPIYLLNYWILYLFWNIIQKYADFIYRPLTPIPIWGCYIYNMCCVF